MFIHKKAQNRFCWLGRFSTCWLFGCGVRCKTSFDSIKLGRASDCPDFFYGRVVETVPLVGFDCAIDEFSALTAYAWQMQLFDGAGM